MENVIYSINGPVVSVKGRTDLQMTEMVFVGNQRLIGEVIKIDSDKTVIYFVLNRFQIGRMREIVHSVDPGAYISITEVADIFGAKQKKD